MHRGNPQHGNVAFKCTYNDQGYAGTCGNATMMQNVRSRVWCSQAENPCRRFVDAGFKGKRPKDPCYESRLFVDLRFGTGVYHSGPDEGRIDKPAHVRDGKIALLTTREPCSMEKDRIIIGAFAVSAQSDREDSYYVAGDAASFFRAPEDARLRYWDYKTWPANGGPAWGSHLYRYITDDEAEAYLEAVHQRVRGRDLRTRVDALLRALHDSRHLV